MSSEITATQSPEISEAAIDEIKQIYSKITQIYEETGIIDEELKIQYYNKLKILPNADEIIEEFEKLLEKLTKDERDQESLKSKVEANEKAVRTRRAVVAPMNQPYEIEKKKTCFEIFADFGKFFNQSISKVGLKYCSESEIVRPNNILTNFNAATNQLGSGQQ